MSEPNRIPKGSSNKPFTALGTHLKYLREQQRESLAEVSGAVEIDIENLERIEDGMERPSEDILLLLINHFNIQENEAVQLWELAGYDHAISDTPQYNQSAKTDQAKPVFMLLATDTRTQYTDSVHIHVDAAGVTMSFGQVNPGNGNVPIARVGMSIDQAHHVLAALQQALLQAKYQSGPKRLPEGDNSGE